jgi:very-short-patch-repair endonuclease
MSAKKYLSQEKHLLLFKEIDPSSGIDLTQWTIYKDETKDKKYPNLPWICSVCSHRWNATLPSRIKLNSGCPDCSKLKQAKSFRKNKINKNGSLAENCPMSLIYWSKLNQDTPYDITKNARDVRIFECPTCSHVWEPRIVDFSDSKGCPKCTKNIYQQETRWVSELETLGFNVSFRAKIDGYECDIYVPELNMGIEIDGFKHNEEKKINFDIKKQVHFKLIGLNFIRFRDKKLPILEDVLQVFYDQNKSFLGPVMNTIRLFLNNFELDSKSKDILQNYVDNNKFVGDELFKKIYSERIPINNLQDLAPEIAKEFSDKNLPVKAKNVFISTAKKYYWICQNGHPDYLQAVANRTGKKPQRCPICAMYSADVDINNSISTTHKNLINKYYDFELNDTMLMIDNEGYSYINLRAGSNKEIFVKCEKGCRFKMRTCHLIRQNIKSFKCKNKECEHTNNKPEEN